MAEEQQTQVRIEGARLSFPDLWEAKAVDKGEPRYSASFLLEKEKDKEQLKKISGLITAMAVAAFGGVDKVKDLRGKGKLRFCLHHGNEKDWDGYDETNMFISTSSKTRPLVLDRDRSPLTKDDPRPYAGCYVDAVIRFWVQDNQYGKAINAELKGVQFVKDGEPFGSGPVSQDDFKDYGAAEKPAEKPKAVVGEAPKADDDEIPF